jgi:hypothetical protein
MINELELPRDFDSNRFVAEQRGITERRVNASRRQRRCRHIVARDAGQRARKLSDARPCAQQDISAEPIMTSTRYRIAVGKPWSKQWQRP